MNLQKAEMFSYESSHLIVCAPEWAFHGAASKGECEITPQGGKILKYHIVFCRLINILI